MKTKKRTTYISGSTAIIIPVLYAEFLEIQKNSEIIIEDNIDDNGKSIIIRKAVPDEN